MRSWFCERCNASHCGPCPHLLPQRDPTRPDCEDAKATCAACTTEPRFVWVVVRDGTVHSAYESEEAAERHMTTLRLYSTIEISVHEVLP